MILYTDHLSVQLICTKLTTNLSLPISCYASLFETRVNARHSLASTCFHKGVTPAKARKPDMCFIHASEARKLGSIRENPPMLLSRSKLSTWLTLLKRLCLGSSEACRQGFSPGTLVSSPPSSVYRFSQ